MTETTATKLTRQQKNALEYLAAKKRRTVSDMVRQAIVEAYDLDSSSLKVEAESFFADSVRQPHNILSSKGNGKASQTAQEGR